MSVEAAKNNLNAKLAVAASNPPNAPQPVDADDSDAPEFETGPAVAPAFGGNGSAPPPPPQQSAAPVPAPDPHKSHGQLFDAVMKSLGHERQYQVDPKSGAMQAIDTPSKPGQWSAKMIAGALSGLAAGGASAQPGDVNPWTRGLASGYIQQQQQAQQQDSQKRQQAAEDFEREQQLLLRQHDIARSNALMLATHFANIKAQNDLDPVRSANKSMAQDLQDSGVPVRFMNEHEAQAAREADPQFVVNHLILPIGHTILTDNDGNVLQDENGQVQRVGNVAVIDGLHDGKVPLPAALADDIQKYGKAAGITEPDTLKAGDEYDMRQIVSLNHKIQEAKAKTAQGWIKPQTVYSKDGTPLQYNPAAAEGEQTRPFPAGVQLKSPEELAASAATTNEKNAQAAKARADAAAGNKDAAKDARLMGYAIDESGDLKYMSKADADKIHSTFEEVKATDVNKDRQAIRQLNDVQKNISAYRKSIDSVKSNINPLAVTNMQAILSDKGFGAKVEPFGIGIDLGMANDAIKGTAVASAWNKLSPEERSVVVGYLRAKGSVLAYQKALTNVGKTNKEQMEIEMANLPLPYVGATVADEQMKAFQENIDRATEGFPSNLPGIKSPKQVRAEVEAEK